MYNTLGIKTDYSILKSLIKVKDLISFCNLNNIKTLGILDDNLFSYIEFYNECINNDIKPLIGLDIILDNIHYYLYAKSNIGLKNLIKINTLVQKKELTINSLKKYTNEVILVIPFNAKNKHEQFDTIFKDIYFAYTTDYEKKNLSVLSKNIVCLSLVNTLKPNQENYFKILDSIRNDSNITKCETIKHINEEDIRINNNFINQIKIEIDKNQRHIPK